MTGREKIERAFTSEGTSQIGTVLCYAGILMRDHWSQITAAPWWLQYSPAVEDQMQWRRDLQDKTGQDWVDVPPCPPRSIRERQRIETRPDGVYMVEGGVRGSRRLEPPQSGGSHLSFPRVPEESLPASAEQIESLIPDRPPFDPAALRASGQCDLADRLLREFPDHFPIGSVGSPLWCLSGLWGFEGLMTMVANRPDLCHLAARRQSADAARHVLMCAELGAKGIWIEECYTDMISPAAFARINVPVLRELCEVIRAAGMRSVYYYCGNPWDRLEHILAVGADAISFEEGKKGFSIDIAEVVEAVQGRCAVLGNLDAIGLLEHGCDEDLGREIRRQVAAGRRNGGRFIMSIGSPVTPGTSIDRVRHYCEMTREYGRA